MKLVYGALAACLLVLGGVIASDAAITVDAFSTATACDPCTSISWSHTVGSGSNRVLEVTSSGVQNTGFTTTCTWDAAGVNEAMTLITDSKLASGTMYIEKFILVNPTAKTADITCSNALNFAKMAGAVSFNGVDQTTPYGDSGAAAGSTSPATVDVSSATGELVTDGVRSTHSTPTVTAGAGQTQIWNVAAGSAYRVAQSTEAGAATTTMSWATDPSNSTWIIAAVSLKPAGGSGGGVGGFFLGPGIGP